MTETQQMIVNRLIDLPSEIAEEELLLARMTARREEAKAALETAEATLLTAAGAEGFPVVNGRNAEQRTAQVWNLTAEERNTLYRLQDAERQGAVRFHRLTNELAALRACARLLGTGD